MVDGSRPLTTDRGREDRPGRAGVARAFGRSGPLTRPAGGRTAPPWEADSRAVGPAKASGPPPPAEEALPFARGAWRPSAGPQGGYPRGARADVETGPARRPASGAASGKRRGASAYRSASDPGQATASAFRRTFANVRRTRPPRARRGPGSEDATPRRAGRRPRRQGDRASSKRWAEPEVRRRRATRCKAPWRRRPAPCGGARATARFLVPEARVVGLRDILGISGRYPATISLPPAARGAPAGAGLAASTAAATRSVTRAPTLVRQRAPQPPPACTRTESQSPAAAAPSYELNASLRPRGELPLRLTPFASPPASDSERARTRLRKSCGAAPCRTTRTS